MYDYTIIGSGPTGLTLALYLANLKKKVLIVEKENSIGGIHRVKRINGLFTEHGPRIYLDNYANFMKILKFLGTSFDQIFSKYDFQISTIGGKSISNFSIREIIIIMFNFININGINKKQSLYFCCYL
jgi:phytoene dehydrogenase-like protein|tara:strand:+ start:8002 stop:8385 length:384 start_codon:yes stop_codon:yes gene_type:complete